MNKKGAEKEWISEEKREVKGVIFGKGKEKYRAG